ncbi:MAG: LPS assembly lipoprotein LptE [Wenzhouxiangella sp.]|jgi:LPS-assembly lipoprotein|nr:LPS assembly lipoprotein LptE [Wenzhouxiangella sp.]
MRVLTLLILTIALTACGFQLRGEARLPAVMSETWLNTPDDNSAFARELALILRANGVSVSSQQREGAAELRILSERVRRDALTISGRARVREFVLGFEVDFELLDASGEILIARETLRMSRDYSFDEQEILAATREEEFLRDEMRRSMAARLLRRLEAL